MFALRIIILLFFLTLTGCGQRDSPGSGLKRLTIGVVSFGENQQSLEQYSKLQNYLSEELNAIIELEPAYNEVKAVQQIKNQEWDIVFAPPGLAAIAKSQQQYTPIISLQGGDNIISIIVVLADSSMQDLPALQGKTVALGQRGSATGYFFPIYNLYGLTLTEVKFAPTPKKILDWIYQKEVDAGAVSLGEYNRFRQDYPQMSFRVLHTDIHEVPNGSIILSPALDSEKRDRIYQALISASPELIESLGYVPEKPVPKYKYLIEVVTRVVPISERIREQPARLYESQ